MLCEVGRSFVNVRAVAVSKSGDLWFAGEQGAFRHDGRTLQPFTRKEGLPSDFVGSLCIDRAGKVWMGHPHSHEGGGVSCYDGKALRHFTSKDGLVSDNVYCVYEDRAGRMWFGTVDAGACWYDGEKFTSVSTGGAEGK